MPDLTVQNEAIERFKMAFKAKKSLSRFNTIKLFNNKIDKITGVLDPDFGKLFAISYDGEDEQKTELDISKTDFFLIGTRVQVSSQFIKMPDGKMKPQYIIPEVPDFSDITLTDSITDEIVASGAYRDLKDKFNLRYAAACYVLVRAEGSEQDLSVYRWEIKGKSLTDFFDLKNYLYDKNATGEPETFKVSKIKAELNGTVWFNVMSLGTGEPFPVETAVQYFSTMESFFNTTSQPVKKNTPVALTEETKNEKISIDNLPF